jgi:hypothetical protein
VAFSTDWKLALVLLSTAPLLLVAGVCYNVFLGGGTMGPKRTSSGQVRYHGKSIYVYF